jgi:hypothetical protein
MSIPTRSHRNDVEGADPFRSQADFVRAVDQVLADAGFRSRLDTHRLIDLSFLAANGDRIAVECGLRKDTVGSERRIQEWISRLLKMRPPIKETLVVSPSFPLKTRESLQAYHGIELVRYADLPQWLERYKAPPRPKQQSRSSRIALAVKANRNQIVVASEALALQIDDKLTKLKHENPNSPEAIAARDSAVSDYEALRAQVTILQEAVAKLTASAKSKEQAAKAAMSFGDGVQGWWKKQHANILEKSAEMGVVLSAVGVCSLLGVSPNMAMAAAVALVGGKSVVKGLRGVAKVNT